jgi:tetratricopeptide (TPR) repeat protein
LAYRDGIKKMEKDLKDNYSLILPIFPYSVTGAHSKASGDMDRAFKKGSKVIQKHSIKVKPEKRPKSTKGKKFYEQPEFVKWTWHAYLLLGKSHFMRRDFFAAIESFSFIIQTYSDLPIKYDAQLWLARTYTEMGNFRRAEPLFRLIEGTADFPKRLERDYNLVKADFHLKQRQLELAAKHLETAVKLTRKKSEVYRYEFILGQIYQEQNDNRSAFAKYSKVMRRNKNYEMSFNSRINLAQIASKDESDNSILKKEINRMIRDEKNAEYLDQLYYALGKIAENETKLADAKTLYLKSAHSSKNNKNQKGQSYLDLGKLLLAEPDYIKAQIYLDSAMGLVSKDIPDYKKYYRLSQNLNELVASLNMVVVQDSLQRMARMTESERNAFVDKAIAELAKKEREEKAREQMDRLAASQMQQRSRTFDDGQSSGGAWYFYNPGILASGALLFQTKWGTRPVEDHWRRSDKASTSVNVFSDQTTPVKPVDENRVSDNTKREFYLQDVPLTDSAMKISDSLIHVAMYKTASVYKDKIEDLQKAQESYQALLKRFPQTIHELESWYFLYKIYGTMGDSKKSEEYKQKVIDKYPYSKYAQSMTNPDFFKQEAAKEQESRFLYSTTYKVFENNQFDKVIANANFADSLYPGNPYRSKFELLKAISIGRTTDSANFVRVIENYIKFNPDAPELAFAKDIRKYLTVPPKQPEGVEKKAEVGLLTEAAKKEEKPVEFIYDPKATHYYGTLIYTKRANTNRIKFNISNMNIDYYPMFEFAVPSEFFSAESDLISVRSFKDSHTAMNYYHSVIFVDEVYSGLTNLDFIHFAISVDNYKKLMETKSINTYMDFFKSVYLKK